jgi:hypothetical protein
MIMVASAWAQNPVAFPGAVGFGANATGGRGGTIYHVTNLSDSGIGSFRDAVSAGHRIVVFDVGGYVVLKSPVSVSSNITIEGQTAPGGGIGVMGAEVSLSGKENVIVRGMRFRQGTMDPDTGKSAVNMGKGSNIILDHCSLEYGQFDSIDAVGTTNVTVQNSIIADPIGQQFGAHVETGPSTFYRNLWVNAHNRQPLSKDNTQYINNVVYDYELGYTAANTSGHFSHDLVNNYFITGPMTTTPSDQFFQMNSNQTVYAVGNMLDSTPDGILNGVSNNIVGQAVIVSSPWAATTTTIPTASATDAYALVTAGAGAFPRDEVDHFVLSDVQSLGLSGRLYKDQALTGIENNGYGIINGGAVFPDSAGVGIPDYWKAANGISTTDPSAGLQAYGTTGYTNIEAYANSLILPAPWIASDLNAPPVRGATSFNLATDIWLLTGSGGAGPSSVDQGQFSFQPWSSDGALTAEIVSLDSGSGGLMVRGGTSAASAYAALTIAAAGQVVFTARSADGQAATGQQMNGVAAPVFLKLVRQNSVIAGYWSSDNVTWNLVGAAPVVLPPSALAGMVVASGSSALAVAEFAQVAFFSGSALNVTDSVSFTASGLVYDRIAHVGSETITVTNNGGATLHAPLQLVLAIDNSAATAKNASGVYNGNPFWISTGSLAPGAFLTITVEFNYALGVSFTTTPTLYSLGL